MRQGIYLTRNEVRVRQFRLILRQAQLALEDARREGGNPDLKRIIVRQHEIQVLIELERTHYAQESVRREREDGPARRHALADQMMAL